MSSSGIEASQPISHLVIVAGVDGSGKSTFLEQLAASQGYIVLEPTSTEEARRFKAETIDTLVDGNFIATREEMYLRLNDMFSETIQVELELTNRVATTGGRIVTQLSHAVMRAIVENAPKTTNFVDDMVDTWLEHGPRVPDALIVVHAPTDVILGRIGLRQDNGDSTEKFWGFNSPFFLHHYQESWLKFAEAVQSRNGLPCLTLDTNELTPEGMIESYVEQIMDRI